MSPKGLRWLTPLVLCCTAFAGDIAGRIHLVKITTDRGFSRRTIAAPALCVGKDGLFLAVGFALDKPEREEARQIRVTIVAPNGDVRGGKILRGNEDMNCTFFRMDKGGAMPEPVALVGAPLGKGERALVLGRHGSLLDHAVWQVEARVEAAVFKPRTLYALQGVDAGKRGCIVATADGRLVGFIDTRSPFRGNNSGFVVGVGTQTAVVVPAQEYAELQHKPPAKAWLGVNLAEFDERREDYFNTGRDLRGALVTGMTKGSPADKAGVKVHDLLQSIGAFQFHYEERGDWARMLRRVQRLPLDRPLECSIIRFTKGSDGSFVAKPMKLTIVLSLRPTDFEDAKETKVEDLEIRVKPITEDWRRLEKLSDAVLGAVVTRVKSPSPASLAGLRTGDLVMAVDRTPVQGPGELVRVLAGMKKAKRKKIVLLVRRGAKTVFVPVEPNW